jgi:hypothetical protein
LGTQDTGRRQTKQKHNTRFPQLIITSGKWKGGTDMVWKELTLHRN